MRFLLVLVSLACAGDVVNLRLEKKQEARNKRAVGRAEYLKPLSPEAKKLAAFLAGHKVERCGLCGDVGVDADGLHCAEQVGRRYGACGDNGCREKILLISRKTLERKGYAPEKGALGSGTEILSDTTVAKALTLAQENRGYTMKKFMAPAGLFCR